MDSSLYTTYVKLLAYDLLSLSSTVPNAAISRKGKILSRAETLGVVTTREIKSGKFLKFTIDDGTGCITCILWLNHLNSPNFFSRRTPSDVRFMADIAARFASQIQLGEVARVRGRITSYRGAIQITVSDVVVERDPNMEILHWLDCIKLARKCYDPISPSPLLLPPTE